MSHRILLLLAAGLLGTACKDGSSASSDIAPPAPDRTASAEQQPLRREVAELRRLVARSRKPAAGEDDPAVRDQLADLRRDLSELRQYRDSQSRTTSSPSVSASASGWTTDWQTEIREEPGLSSVRPVSAAASPVERAVRINGQPVDAAKLEAFEQVHGVRLPKGSYWYDRRSGAFGVFGGPCTGYAMAGLDVAGPMPANCSGGGTGVFVNGRELHRLEVLLLSQVTTVSRGRYTLDARGNVGIEGGPFLYNVFQVGQQMMARGGGGQGGSWSHTGLFGHTGGDGETFYFLDGDSSYISGQ